MTNDEKDLNRSGERLAALAVEHVAHDAELYCSHECERIALENEPQIRSLGLEGRALDERRADLEEKLRGMPPSTDPIVRKRRARYYAVVGLFLALAAFAFTIIGFGPYRLGMIAILYCLGIALATPFAVDEFLREWKTDNYRKATVIVVFIAAILGGVLLAAIRGELLSRKVEEANAPVVIDGATEQPAQTKPSFYESTEMSLQVLMLLFALAIDLGSGIALHRARIESEAVPGEYEIVTRELGALRQRLREIVHEITALQNAPAAFAATFWRDFYSAALTQTIRKAIVKGAVLTLVACAVVGNSMLAAQRTNLVVALDRSVSEGVTDDTGRTAFRRNVDAIARLLASAPADSRITVVAITQDSIADPHPMLSAEIPAESGYFGDGLSRARQTLVQHWRARTANLAPSARGTDIIGALFLASELFRREPKGARNILAIFSDMRNRTCTLDLETATLRKPEAVLARMQSGRLIPDLSAVSVYVAGANGGGTNAQGWGAIRSFWIGYFTKAGAQRLDYSMLADPPTLARELVPPGR